MEKRTYEEVHEMNTQMVIDYINSLRLFDEVEYCFTSYDIDEDTIFDDITEILEGCSKFDVEVIYYDRAMKYLCEHDMSLTRSLEIAEEYGYKISDLNCEVLASLIASEDLRNTWEDHRQDIDSFLSTLDWSYEDED